MHSPLRVSLRHFLVKNSAPGCHPLDVAGAELAPVSQAVAVIHASREHIGNCLDAAVRVPWKSRAVVVWTFIAEIIEQEEWVELARITEAEGTAQFHACAFDRGFGFDGTLNGPNGHVGLTSLMAMLIFVMPGVSWLCFDTKAR